MSYKSFRGEYEEDEDLGLFLEVWNNSNAVVKSENDNYHQKDDYDVDLAFMFTDDNNDNNVNGDINYLDDFIPITSSSSSSSSSSLMKISSSSKIKTNKKTITSSSSSSLLPSSPLQNMNNNEDVTNTKTLLFGNKFTYPSIDIFPAVISGPWNDANYYGSDDEDDDDNNNNNNDKKKRKRQRSKNPDYDLITVATETNLKLLNINPDSKEGKAERRRIRNKLSAQMHRERKKAYIVYLEKIVRHRESTITTLNENMEKLKRENEEFKAYFVNNKTVKTNNNDTGYTTESVTSSDDEDTISVNARAGVSSATSPLSESSSTTFKSKFSLFSVLFMFGFTFFGPFNANNNIGTSVSLFQAPSLLGYSTIVNSNSLLQLAPPIEFSEYVDTNTKVSGRVLLSLPNELTSEQDKTTNPLPKLNITPLNPVVSKSKALWKYQDRVLHLFPKLATLPKSKKRNLRSHPSNQDYETALVPAMSSRYDDSSKKEPTSRVLLTEGKALLDPDLGRVVDITGSGDQKTGSSLSLALSTWTNSNSQSQSQYQSHTNSIVSVRAEDSNLLLMLLPANQIRWGKSWEDGKDTISSGITDNIDGYSKDDIDSAWVEIGCSVFKAQLVKNITMM